MSEYPSGVAVYEFPKETCGNGHPGKYVDLRAYTALAEHVEALERNADNLGSLVKQLDMGLSLVPDGQDVVAKGAHAILQQLRIRTLVAERDQLAADLASARAEVQRLGSDLAHSYDKYKYVQDSNERLKVAVHLLQARVQEYAAGRGSVKTARLASSDLVEVLEPEVREVLAELAIVCDEPGVAEAFVTDLSRVSDFPVEGTAFEQDQRYLWQLALERLQAKHKNAP